MKLNRLLTAAAYLMATLLIAIPLSEALLSVWPLRGGTAAWRFGAVGIVSRTMMTALLGLFMACATAFYLGHRRTLRTFSVLSAVALLVIAAVSGLFVLDAIEMRAQVRPEAKTAFDAASVQALSKLGLSGIMLLLLGWGGWKAGRKSEGERRRTDAEAAPVLVSVGAAGKAARQATAAAAANAAQPDDVAAPASSS